LLMSLMRGEELAESQVLLQPELIERSSSSVAG
jgi:DNA-binding LacI/PurR family transcriptional regulator